MGQCRWRRLERGPKPGFPNALGHPGRAEGTTPRKAGLGMKPAREPTTPFRESPRRKGRSSTPGTALHRAVYGARGGARGARKDWSGRVRERKGAGAAAQRLAFAFWGETREGTAAPAALRKCPLIARPDRVFLAIGESAVTVLTASSREKNLAATVWPAGAAVGLDVSRARRSRSALSPALEFVRLVTAASRGRRGPAPVPSERSRAPHGNWRSTDSTAPAVPRESPARGT